MSFHQFLIPRLNGERILNDMERSLALVRQGVAGFIIFGGELEEVREAVQRLQCASLLPLVISSDLEQGLGQQLKGGTLFPPAMAMAQAGRDDPALLDAAFAQIADEAAYAGINTIYAPVLDINTNPDNPIICTRSFGEDALTVSSAALRMIRAFQSRGVTACGKHFPGHGDTVTDSHLSLPVLDKSLAELEGAELIPFERAIGAGVGMIMLAHLAANALDDSGVPVSLSVKALRYLRERMDFSGIVVTDAMDMGGLGGYSPEEAALMALRAGADILLHPSEPERLAASLKAYAEDFDTQRLNAFRATLGRAGHRERPSFDPALANSLTEKAITVSGMGRRVGRPHVVILNDGAGDKGGAFVDELKRRFLSIAKTVINAESTGLLHTLPDGADLIVAIFSPIRAYKGGVSGWLKNTISLLEHKACAFVSFGSPYILPAAGEGTINVRAYWDSESAQRAAGRAVLHLLA